MNKNCVWGKFILSMTICLTLFDSTDAQSATTRSITQWGITWSFDREYEYGRFANGDYWVLGPVTVTRIQPDYDGNHNGWEVNPRVGVSHGFDSGCKNGGFNSNKVPTLPYTTNAPIESIVKVISSGRAQPCVKTAAVLTVVNSIPAGNGRSAFRPPYTGTVKPFYQLSDLKSGLLPSYPPEGLAPSFSAILDSFKYFRLEHLTSPALRDLRPSDAMENYSPKNAPKNHEAIIRLMLNDSLDDKLPALIKLVQHGIDKCHAIMQGWMVASADGHDPGHRIIAAFAATMLEIEEAKRILVNADGFHEDITYVMGENTLGPDALWGVKSTESNYWGYIRGLGGNRSQRDPYGYIDGGLCGEEYQLIVAQSHKGSILATQLMPILKEAWNPAKWKITANYVDRWVNEGTMAQPDPCAPFDGSPNNYGITYGPSEANPSGCILDQDLKYYQSATNFACKPGKACGRFPEKQGKDKDGGFYKSRFVEAMWNAYGSDLRSPRPPQRVRIIR